MLHPLAQVKMRNRAVCDGIIEIGVKCLYAFHGEAHKDALIRFLLR
jgi:hypothetical protein